MAEFKDLTGQRFGRLLVIDFSHKNNGCKYWNCICDCGKTKAVNGSHMQALKVRSCGCLRNEVATKRLTVHGMTKTPIHNTWVALRSRCIDPADTNYERYGARGITVCPEWMDSFSKFYEDMGSTWFKGATIERIDVNGNYEKENCTWITRGEQSKNKTNSIIIDTPWGRMNAMYVAEKLGMHTSSFYERIHKWPKERWFEPRMRPLKKSTT